MLRKGNEVDEILWYLLDTFERMKHGRKKRIPFQLCQVHVIRLCLNDWRNSFLSSGDEAKAEGVTDVLIRFI